MSEIMPIVSVIVPTTGDRMDFNNRIEKIFYAQDYPNKQLLFDYDAGTVGEKRNRLCEMAIGDILLHQDSDDFYSPNWIANSVYELQRSGADIVGLSKVTFYDTRDKAWYVYSFGTAPNNWVAGASMAYWKEFWRKNPFPPMQVGEDNGFLVGKAQKPKIVSHDFVDGFVATIHDKNTSRKILANPRYRRCNEEEEKVLFERWDKLLNFKP